MRTEVLEYFSKSIILVINHHKYEFWPQLIVNIVFENSCSYYIHDGSSYLFKYLVLFLEIKHRRFENYAFF